MKLDSIQTMFKTKLNSSILYQIVLSLLAKNIKDSLLYYHDDTASALFEDWFQKKSYQIVQPAV